MLKSYPGFVDDLNLLHHSDMHKNEFELMLRMYTQEQNKFNLDIGVVGGVGVCLNHFVYYPEWVFDNFFETKNMEKLNYLLIELDSEMQMGYDYLIETEDFDI